MTYLGFEIIKNNKGYCFKEGNTTYENWKGWNTIEEVKKEIEKTIFLRKQAKNYLNENNGNIKKALLNWTIEG